MDKITNLLPVTTGDVLSIIGSGGKTTLLWLLAQHARVPRLMVSTTTHMQSRPQLSGCICSHSLEELKSKAPLQPGLYFCGVPQPSSGKLSAFSPQELHYLARQMDAVILESDGSKMLPLKGWASHEPVVPPFTTKTVGVIPLWPVGHPADTEHIHRPNLFKSLTGIQKNAPITLQHIAAAISSPNGLFKKAVGERILFISQVEDEQAFCAARQLLEILPLSFLQSLQYIIAGSARLNEGELLWKQ